VVFVTVGNSNYRFRRLLDSVDALAGHGILKGEHVLIQAGHTPDFQPKYCKLRPFLPTEEFEKCLEQAELIISHCGSGTVLPAIQLGKLPVVMPRLKRYGEHVDDHQVQFVEALAAEGWIVPAYEPEDLPAAIAEARRRSRQPVPPPPSRMQSLVAQAIEDLIGKP
jgi:UDP-N-acetylglucosamine transferase subunit ALG13